MIRGFLASTVLLAGCAGPPLPETAPAEIASRSAEIVAGTIEPGRPEVFFLILEGGNTPDGFFACSATLIGARTLLTAAHCLACLVDPVSIHATNQKHPFDFDTGEVSPSLTTIPATAWRTHPDAGVNCSTGMISGRDVGMVQLAYPPAASPRAWADTPLPTNLAGRKIPVVGYGATMLSGAGAGRRRSGLVTVTSLGPVTFSTTPTPSTTCFGDSGGPYLATFTDGIERVVGVTSEGDSTCVVGGIAARVDVSADFIRTSLAELDPSSCLPDGVCSPACADPATDPDCPESCAPNGLCSATSCATPDPDCAPLGAPCIASVQCAGARCVSDPQHTDGYCSRACAVDGDCGAGMVCDGMVCRYPQRPVVALGGACVAGVDACAGDGICAPVGGAAPTCRAQCDVPADCPSANCLVDGGLTMTGICGDSRTHPDAGTSGTPSVSSSTKSGCSTGTGPAVPPVLVLLLAWLVMQRSRRPPTGTWAARRRFPG